MKSMPLSWLGVLIVLAGLLFAGSRAHGQATPGHDATIEQRLDRLERQVQLLVDRPDRVISQGDSRPDQRMMPSIDGQQQFRPAPPMPWHDGHPARWHGVICLILLVLMIVNILLAIWVFTDIRKRGEGSGLFIILALLAGLPGTILYALVRIGDRKPS